MPLTSNASFPVIRNFVRTVSFLEELISAGYAEKVPKNVLVRSDGKVWFIPQHSVYHHKKPDKMRVLLNCFAQFHGTPLNNELFQGPDLTNSLVVC